MAKIQQPPGPVFPWGGPRSVRERLIDPSQLQRANKKGRKGDPKNPALPSADLMDFIGPAHTADEARLPMPPNPRGHDAELAAFSDRPHLQSAVERGLGGGGSVSLDEALERLPAAPDRLERLKALLGREQQMLALVGQLHQDVDEIQRRIRDEQKERGY
jgi:hypothetical protein